MPAKLRMKQKTSQVEPVRQRRITTLKRLLECFIVPYETGGCLFGTFSGYLSQWSEITIEILPVGKKVFL